MTSEPEWKGAGVNEREKAPSAPPCPVPRPHPQAYLLHKGTHTRTCAHWPLTCYMCTDSHRHTRPGTLTLAPTLLVHMHACAHLSARLSPVWAPKSCPGLQVGSPTPSPPRTRGGVGCGPETQTHTLCCSPLFSGVPDRGQPAPGGYWRPRLSPAPQGPASSWGSLRSSEDGDSVPALPLSWDGQACHSPGYCWGRWEPGDLGSTTHILPEQVPVCSRLCPCCQDLAVSTLQASPISGAHEQCGVLFLGPHPSHGSLRTQPCSWTPS